jgi:2,4-dienoyl-CoA reductase-like NADH-dependent reductase (Old Yellow Enzyme family)
VAKNVLIVVEICYFLYLFSEASDVTSSSEITQGNTPLLFTPMTIGGLHIRNRIIASPMCQYLSVDGAPTDWHLMHLGRLAIGGCGVVFGEETAVEPAGRKTHACAGLYSAGHVSAYRKLTDMIKSHGAVPAIQLGHSGRKGSCHGAMEDWRPLTDVDAANGLPPWQIMTPTAAVSPPRPIPHKEMDQDDIKRVIDDFRTATKRSLDAGYDIVEIHGAHGYLIHQFLSDTSNHRDDHYGGSLENRMRFAVEVAAAVRQTWPKDKPVFFRLSAVDGKGGSWTLGDSVALAAALRDVDIDMIDVSSGGIAGSSNMPMVPRIPAYQASFAGRIRRQAKISTIAVGGITTARQAEDILQSGDADMIAMARELLWNADWPAHAAQSLGIDDPFSYLPVGYAHRLRQREEQKKMKINQDAALISQNLGFFLDNETPSSEPM